MKKLAQDPFGFAEGAPVMGEVCEVPLPKTVDDDMGEM
jgi:hypothetical protein